MCSQGDVALSMSSWQWEQLHSARDKSWLTETVFPVKEHKSLAAPQPSGGNKERGEGTTTPLYPRPQTVLGDHTNDEELMLPSHALLCGDMYTYIQYTHQVN